METECGGLFPGVRWELIMFVKCREQWWQLSRDDNVIPPMGLPRSPSPSFTPPRSAPTTTGSASQAFRCIMYLVQMRARLVTSNLIETRRLNNCLLPLVISKWGVWLADWCASWSTDLWVHFPIHHRSLCNCWTLIVMEFCIQKANVVGGLALRT